MYTIKQVRQITCVETNTTYTFTDEQWQMAVNLVIKAFGTAGLNSIANQSIKANCVSFLSEQLDMPSLQAHFLIDAIVEIER